MPAVYPVPVLQLEYGLAVRMVARPDFAEGVRAVLVDKCKAPTWTPATLDGISDAAVVSVLCVAPSHMPDEGLHAGSDTAGNMRVG